jgi:hypothetical protein
MKPSEATVCVCDCGLFVSIARRLAREFKRVLYFSPWVTAFPTSNSMLIGDGFDDIERINRPWDRIDEVDLWVFPDVYFADWQNMLVRLGKRVWGARNGELLELYRDESKQLLKELGLPVAPYEVIEGMEALRAYLRDHEDVWVKVSCVRGDFETFHSENYDLSEPKLDEIEYKLGAKKFVAEFIVEDNIPDAVEVGYDGFTVDGDYPAFAFMGYEIKDLGYIGSTGLYSELPEPVKFVNRKLSPWFDKQQYRGFMSTELRITKDGTPYLIDPCARAGSPPSEVYQELYDNWGEIIWSGAGGDLVEPVPTAKYAVQAMIHSAWADKNWQAVEFPDEVARYVKLRNHTRIRGKDYCVPQAVGLPEIGAVIGLGDTLLEAVEHLRINAEQVKGYFLEIKLDSIGEAVEQMRKGEEYGLSFTDQELPETEEIAAAASKVDSD